MLANHGFTVTTAQNLQTAFEYLNSHISAFLVLDLDLEGAVPFLEKVINTFYDPPPYILAVDYFPCSQSQADILNLGADACLEKPLDLEEVLAVINAALRRAERLSKPKPLHAMPRIEHKGLSIDPLRRHVSMECPQLFFQFIQRIRIIAADRWITGSGRSPAGIVVCFLTSFYAPSHKAVSPIKDTAVSLGAGMVEQNGLSRRDCADKFVRTVKRIMGFLGGGCSPGLQAFYTVFSALLIVFTSNRHKTLTSIL